MENRDGAWLAIADASGTGPTAAGLGAAALGALRAARRSGQDLTEALALMHDTVRRLEHDEFRVPAWVARWHAATATLAWVSCGHPSAYLVDADGALEVLKAPKHPALGEPTKTPTFQVSRRQLHPGQRLIVVTDGITERRLQGGGNFGVQGVRQAVAAANNQTAATTAMAIQQAVTDCWREPLQDDGTIVVLAID